MNTPEENSLLLNGEWREKLSSEVSEVLENAKTEAAFSGKFWNFKAVGTYCCENCGEPLFTSGTKFDSGTGWPSFCKPCSPSAVTFHIDFQLVYPRKEVRCSCCQSHLGHLFDDGPAPTFKRYCINSSALAFIANSPI